MKNGGELNHQQEKPETTASANTTIPRYPETGVQIKVNSRVREDGLTRWLVQDPFPSLLQRPQQWG